MKRTHETGRMKVAAARLIAVLSTALLLLAPLPARCQEERRPPKPPKPPRPEDAVAAFIQFGDSFRDSVEEEKERLATKTGSGGDSEYTQFKRWEWITGQRLGPDEEVVNVAYKTRYECNRYAASETLQEIRKKAVSGGAWRSLGPSRFTLNAEGTIGGLGRVNALAFDANRPSVLYAGSASGPLWRSIDDGAGWSAISPPHGVSGIAVDPTDSQTIYMLTGDGNGYGGRAYYLSSLGVLKTTDGGRTWSSTSPLVEPVDSEYYGYALKMSPADNRLLFAATSRGLHMTTDGGGSWRKVVDNYFYDIEFEPGDPTIVYASTQCCFYKLRLTQKRHDWTATVVKKISFPEPSDARGFCCGEWCTSRIELAVTAARPGRVYAVYGGDYGLAGFFRSDDGGESFTLQSSTPNILASERLGWGTSAVSWYDLAIAASPADADEVFVGGFNLWKTTDGGVTWSLVTYYNQRNPLYLYRNNHNDHHALEFFEFALYDANDGGVYMKPFNEPTWTDLSAGLRITQIYRLCGRLDDLDILFYGAQDNGINKLMKHTAAQIFSNDGATCLVDPDEPNVVYVTASPGAVLLKSMDGGSSLQAITPPGIDPEQTPWVLPFTLDPDDHQKIYACYEDVWTSPNRGVSWTRLSLPEESTADGCVQIAVTPRSGMLPSYVYMARTNSVWRAKACDPLSPSCDWEWQDISGDLCRGKRCNAISDLAIDRDHLEKVWVTFSGFDRNDEDSRKVFRGSATLSGNFRWENVSGTLPNVSANTILLDGDAAYVGMDCGVYYRDPSLPDWIPFNDHLGNYAPTDSQIPTVMVEDLLIQRHKTTGNKWIRAATFNWGMWESPVYPGAGVPPRPPGPHPRAADDP